MIEPQKPACGVCRRKARTLTYGLLGGAPPPACVLFVDDVVEVARFMAEAIAAAGYEAHAAYDGAQAIEAARKARPDVILMNYLMPVLDGLSALRLLKADAVLRNVPVLMHSARDTREFVRELEAAGAAGFLARPFPLAKMLKEIERVLEA